MAIELADFPNKVLRVEQCHKPPMTFIMVSLYHIAPIKMLIFLGDAANGIVLKSYPHEINLKDLSVYLMGTDPPSKK